jgi:hypothetical protein
MKSLDNELEGLSDELERLDYVVVRHGDWVCVRLPLISSVRIHHTTDGRFRFVPQIGPFRRSAGLLFTSAVAGAADPRFPRCHRADTRRMPFPPDGGMHDAAPAACR